MKIGIVGGSDYSKIAEQLGEGDDGESQTASALYITLHDLTLFLLDPLLNWMPVYRELI